MIPYGRQLIGDDDIAAVLKVLKSDFLTQGPMVPSFEKSVSSYCGVKHCVVTNSATSSLHLACLALGLKQGDRVWTSPNSFVASANAALYCGAKIDFVDIDPRTFNLCVSALEEKLIEASKQNKLPKIVIPVHFAGQSPDMKAIRSLADEYGFKVLEDAAHSFGARYCLKPHASTQCCANKHGEETNGKNEENCSCPMVGSCVYSDITVFSFHPVKIITSGEGGAGTTNNLKYRERMQLLRSHGVTRERDSFEDDSYEPWLYNQIALGYNYRMTDICAALGISQITKTKAFIEARHNIAGIYDAELSRLPIVIPTRSRFSLSSFHLYPILLANSEIRRNVFNVFRDNDVLVNVHYFPIHMQPYFRKFGFKDADFPNAFNYYQRTLSLPIYPDLSDVQQSLVIEMLKQSIA